MNIDFRCPKCSGSVLCEVQTDCTITTPVYALHRLSESAYESELGDLESVCDGTIAYLCGGCRYKLRRDDHWSVGNEPELYDWLRTRGMLNEREA